MLITYKLPGNILVFVRGLKLPRVSATCCFNAVLVSSNIYKYWNAHWSPGIGRDSVARGSCCLLDFNLHHQIYNSIVSKLWLGLMAAIGSHNLFSVSHAFCEWRTSDWIVAWINHHWLSALAWSCRLFHVHAIYSMTAWRNCFKQWHST